MLPKMKVSSVDEAEALILRLCAEVLGKDHIAAEDNFFSIGGDSLAAMHLIGRLRQETRTAVPVRLLFEYPDLGALAKRVVDYAEPSLAVDGDDPRAQLREAFGAEPDGDAPNPELGQA